MDKEVDVANKWLNYDEVITSKDLKVGSILEIKWEFYNHLVAYLGGDDHLCYNACSVDKSGGSISLQNLINPQNVKGIHKLEPLKTILTADGPRSPPLKCRIDRSQPIEGLNKENTKKPRSVKEMLRLAKEAHLNFTDYNIKTINCEHYATALVYGSNSAYIDPKEGWSNSGEVMNPLEGKDCSIQ